MGHIKQVSKRWLGWLNRVDGPGSIDTILTGTLYGIGREGVLADLSPGLVARRFVEPI